jgi:hypothetical protein
LLGFGEFLIERREIRGGGGRKLSGIQPCEPQEGAGA